MKFFMLILMTAFSAFADFFPFQIHPSESSAIYLFANDLKPKTFMLDVFSLKKLGNDSLSNTIVFEILSTSALKISDYQTTYDFTFEKFQEIELGKIEINEVIK